MMRLGRRSLVVLSVVLALRCGSRPALAAEREVEFEGAGGVRLSGTLTLPAAGPGAAPVPGVLLVAGSGPTDRNGNQPPLLWTGLLKQTADLLADGGIASLRFDKRGVGRSGRPPKEFDALVAYVAWNNFVSDVAAARRALKGQAEIDPLRVGLLGHSEGGLLVMQAAAAMQAAGEPPTAVVLLSTPGRRLDLILRDQLAASMARLGVSAKGTATLLERNDSVVAAIRETGAVPPDVPPELAPLYPRYAGRFLHAQLRSAPAKLAAQLAGPVLVVQGGKDLQVSSERDAPLLDAALKRRPGGPPSRLLILPGASHNLKPVERRGQHAFYGPVVTEFGPELVGWLREQLGRPL